MIVATSAPRKWKIGSALIKWYQGGTKYSHVLLINGDMVYQASHGWVNCCYIENFLEENTIFDVYEVEDEVIDFEFVKQQIGKRYSYMQILKIAISFVFKMLLGVKLRFSQNGDKRFICSEFIGRAMNLPWVDDFTDPKQIDTFLKHRQ